MHIFYVWEWGAGVGHLRRFAPIAERLHDSGHRITIVSRETMQVRQFFSRERFGLLQAPVQSGRTISRFPNPQTIAGLAWNLGFDHPQRIEGVFDAWSELLRRFRPDALISDFGFAASIMARAYGIPTVRMGTGFECPPAWDQPASLFGDASTVMAAERRLAESILLNINRVLRANRLQPLAGWAEMIGESVDSVLATIPPLDPYRNVRRHPEYVGAWDADSGASPRWSSGGQGRALAYLKPFPMLANLIAAVNAAGIGVCVVGDGIADHQLRGLDQRMTVVCPDLVNLREAAAECQFMITNGNHGTTVRSLSLGRPVMACPLFIEQRLTGHLIEEQRLGVNVHAQEPKTFAAGVARLVGDREISENARKFATEFDPLIAGADERAVERIGSVLGLNVG